MITRIFALLVMGFIGLFTIAFPITTLTAAGSKDVSAGTGVVIALLLTAIIVFTGRAKSVWATSGSPRARAAVPATRFS
jgi:hypothetical protein